MSMQVEIVSAEEEIFSGKATRVFATGVMGDLGITIGHAPLLTTLEPGPVRIVHEGGSEDVIFVSGGILEVQPDMVMVLADTVVRMEGRDLAEMEKAKEKAERKLLKASSGEGFDYKKAKAELRRAAGMLKALKSARKRL